MIYLVVLLAVLIQAVAGYLIWCSIRPQANAIESFGMSIALGTMTAVTAGVILQPLTQWGWLLPGLIAVTLCLIPRIRMALIAGRTQRDSTDTGLVVALVLGMFLVAVSFALSIRSYPLSWEGTWSGFHGDMPFFEALSRSIPLVGPFDSIFAPGQMVHYHWLTYAWAGQLTTSLDAAPFLVLTRILPLVAMIGSVSLIAAWTKRMTSAVWAPSVAVVLLLMGGHLGVVYGSVFNFDSPSQSLSVLWLIAFVLLLIAIWPTKQTVARLILISGLMAIVSAGLLLSKVSTGAVGMAVVVALAVWQLVRSRKLSSQQVLIFIVSSGSMLTAYLVFVAGGNGGGGITIGSLLDRASSEQGMNPTVGALGVALGTAILVLAIAARWLGVLWLATDRAWRAKPEFAVGLGLVAAGAGSVALFNGGQNELWFAAAAAGPLSALCAVGVAQAWTYVCLRSKFTGAKFVIVSWISILIASAVIFLVVWLLWATGPSGGNVWAPTSRWLAPILGIGLSLLIGFVFARILGIRSPVAGIAVMVIVVTFAAAPGRLLGIGTGQVGASPVKRTEFFSIPELSEPFIDQENFTDLPAQFLAAGEFLRLNANSEDRVATNVTRSAIVPAVTGLQTIVSGTWYQAPYGARGGEVILLDREKLSYSFIDSPSAATLAPLCELGATWVWIDSDRTEQTDWSQYLMIDFEADGVIVGRIIKESC